MYLYNTLEYTNMDVYSKVLYTYTKIRVHNNLGYNWFGDLYIVKHLILGDLACRNFYNFQI